MLTYSFTLPAPPLVGQADMVDGGMRLTEMQLMLDAQRGHLRASHGKSDMLRTTSMSCAAHQAEIDKDASRRQLDALVLSFSGLRCPSVGC